MSHLSHREAFASGNPLFLSASIRGVRDSHGQRTYGQRTWKLMMRRGKEGAVIGAVVGAGVGLGTGIVTGMVLSSFIDGGLLAEQWGAVGIIGGTALGTLVGSIGGYLLGMGVGFVEATLTDH